MGNDGHCLHKKWMPLSIQEASIFVTVENPDNYEIVKNKEIHGSSAC